MKRVLVMAAMSVGSVIAMAGEHRYGPYPALYGKECTSCHVAYPPELMTANGWRQVMQQLDKHFGVDASLDAATHTEIAIFLQKQASRQTRHAPTESTGRLSRTAWFVREHGATPPAKVSFGQCSTCHQAAEKGDYSERGLRLPSGWRHPEGAR